MIPKVPIHLLNEQLAAEVAEDHGLGGNTTLGNVLGLLQMGADCMTLTEDKRLKLFHAALVNGWLNVSMAIVQAGTDVSRTAKDERVPPMMSLASCFNQQLLDAVILSGSDLTVKDQKGRSFTHWAAMKNCLPLIEQLALRGEINTDMDLEGNTPMHVAASRGHGKACLALAAQGLDINASNGSGKTPLLLAACEGWEEACMNLISRGADPFFKFKKKSIWAMARAKKKNLVADQIKAAADSKKAKDSMARVMDFILELEGGAPRIAARTSKKKLNDQLMEAAGTSQQIQSLSGLKRLQSLVEAGANPSLLSEESRLRIFFHALVQQKELGDVLPLAMLRAGTDVTAGLPSDLSDHPSAALLTTAHFFSEPVFDAILASRPDPGLCDEQGRTMFHLLCHTGNWFAARKWLSLGGSHEEPDVRGHLPLHTAAERGFAQVCSGLIQCGSDPNALNRENESPLLLAASSGHSETCMALLNLGADPFFVHKGHTIRETAEKKGHEDLADQLKAWEAALHASRSVEAAMANTKSTKPTKRTKAPG